MSIFVLFPSNTCFLKYLTLYQVVGIFGIIVTTPLAVRDYVNNKKKKENIKKVEEMGLKEKLKKSMDLHGEYYPENKWKFIY